MRMNRWVFNRGRMWEGGRGREAVRAPHKGRGDGRGWHISSLLSAEKELQRDTAVYIPSRNPHRPIFTKKSSETSNA